VIKWESQAVLNTFTEHDFYDVFKNGISSGNGAYAWKETTSCVMVASGPKVSFWPDDSTSLGNYGWLFVTTSYWDKSKEDNRKTCSDNCDEACTDVELW
jgi:hypothetical protein